MYNPCEYCKYLDSFLFKDPDNGDDEWFYRCKLIKQSLWVRCENYKEGNMNE